MYFLSQLHAFTYAKSFTLEKSLRYFYSNKNVVVTGGAGFVGSHLVERLVDLGAHVTVLDDLSTGSYDNLALVADKITFVQGSITNQKLVFAVLDAQDIVFHTAALVSVPLSVQHPQVCYEININGLITLLEGCRIQQVPRFIFSSSCAVYGSCEEPCSEDTICKPESPYGFSKYIGELYCQYYARMFGLQTLSLRYFNVYGPRHKGVIAAFENALKAREPLVVFGDGTQTRDFVPVELVVDANVIAGMLAHTKAGHCFNVATGISLSIAALAKAFQESFPEHSIEIQFKPARYGDVLHSQADCTRFEQLLQEAATYQENLYG